MASENLYSKTVQVGRASARKRVARVVTEALSPVHLVPGLILVVAWKSSEDTGEGVTWGVLAAGLAMAVPIAYLRRELRAGRISDHNVRVRSQRPRVLLVTTASILTTLGVVAAGDAPRDLVALVSAQAVGLVLFGIITRWWKISFHAGGTAGTVTTLVLVFGPRLLLLTPLVPLAAWSRVTLGDHTPCQVSVGAALGGVVAWVVFSWIR